MSKEQLMGILMESQKDPPPRTGDPVMIRKWFNTQFSQLPPPEGIAIEKINFKEFNAELIIPEGNIEEGLVMYYHGRGFIFGNLQTHRRVAAGLAKSSNRNVLHVEYRLAPENKIPAAHQDAITTYQWALKNDYIPKSIALCGDSAGGNLALSTAVFLRNNSEELPACLGLISPAPDTASEGESHKRTIDDPIRPTPPKELFNYSYAGESDKKNPVRTPFYGDLSGLPTTLFYAGSWAVLYSDSVNVAKKINASGGNAEVKVWEGMIHSMQLFAPMLDEAKIFNC